MIASSRERLDLLQNDEYFVKFFFEISLHAYHHSRTRSCIYLKVFVNGIIVCLVILCSSGNDILSNNWSYQLKNKKHSFYLYDDSIRRLYTVDVERSSWKNNRQLHETKDVLMILSVNDE